MKVYILSIQVTQVAILTLKKIVTLEVGKFKRGKYKIKQENLIKLKLFLTKISKNEQTSSNKNK